MSNSLTLRNSRQARNAIKRVLLAEAQHLRLHNAIGWIRQLSCSSGVPNHVRDRQKMCTGKKKRNKKQQEKIYELRSLLMIQSGCTVFMKSKLAKKGPTIFFL